MKHSGKPAILLTLTAMVLCSLFCGLYLFREYTKIHTITHIGDMWSFVRLDETASYAPFTEVDRNDFPGPPYPEPGDLLVAVGGRPATRENYFTVFTTDTPAGKSIDIMFMHGGELMKTEIVTRTIPEPLKFQIWLMFVLRFLMVLGLIVVGIWGFSRKAGSQAVRTLTLFCTTLSVQMVLSSAMISDAYAGFQLPIILVIIFAAVGTASASFWLRLNLLFPVRNEKFNRSILLNDFTLFLPAAIVGGAWMLTSNQPLLGTRIYSTIFLLAGFIFLIGNFRKAGSFIERRQTKLVLLGSISGISLYTVWLWITYYLAQKGLRIPVQTNMLLFNIIFLFLLPIPVAILYAFRRYRLLEVEGKLKRGTRFLAINLALLLVFLAVLYMFGEFFLEALGISSQTPTLVMGLILAMAFMPTQRKLRKKVEDHFYPERKKLRDLLRDFLGSGISETEEEDFWRELSSKLSRGLGTADICPVLITAEGNAVKYPEGKPAPFDSSDSLLASLENRSSSLLMDEALESGRINLKPDQKTWLQKRKCAVLLPLTVKKGLIGFLAIGRKTSGEDFTAEELDLLTSFSAQIALSVENIQLLREKIEKQKLQEQLKVAREIQEGLLPKKIPQVAGIEIRALIRFCLDVAGDYYDVMHFPDGRVTMAIADVAGKGVGPALLMANLQASLRTAQEMGSSLSESAKRINNLVCDNTPSDLFITFFIASIDPSRNTLRYVNAGHNPPVLLKENGDHALLSRGGLLLGVKKNITYETGSVDFMPGDSLFMFTDGVTEAMNDMEEEFGEKRLLKVLGRNSGGSLGDIIDSVERAVEEFHGSSHYADDFTLLAAQRLTPSTECEAVSF